MDGDLVRPQGQPERPLEEWLVRYLRQTLARVRYGTVSIKVQDGVVVSATSTVQVRTLANGARVEPEPE